MPKTDERTREQAIADDLGPSIRHLDGCPAERIEGYVARRPAGDEISVARCVDCGEATYE